MHAIHILWANRVHHLLKILLGCAPRDIFHHTLISCLQVKLWSCLLTEWWDGTIYMSWYCMPLSAWWSSRIFQFSPEVPFMLQVRTCFMLYQGMCYCPRSYYTNQPWCYLSKFFIVRTFICRRWNNYGGFSTMALVLPLSSIWVVLPFPMHAIQGFSIPENTLWFSKCPEPWCVCVIWFPLLGFMH